MVLTVNGERRETAATRIAALLDELDFAGEHLAVAVNYEVVPRTQWGTIVLRDGDAVEILAPAQGG